MFRQLDVCNVCFFAPYVYWPVAATGIDECAWLLPRAALSKGQQSNGERSYVSAGPGTKDVSVRVNALFEWLASGNTQCSGPPDIPPSWIMCACVGERKGCRAHYSLDYT